jgi:uncharacterized protein
MRSLLALWRTSRWVGRLGVLLALGLLLRVAHAQDLQPVPTLTARVLDTTGTLDASRRAGLEAKLAALEASKGAQVVLLIVSTTQPEDIASYANRVANDWRIGRKGVGDGVLLVVALKDRKVRIEVAKTLEGAIPDLAARRIIDEAITPAFRQGDYAGGLDAGVERIAGLIQGEPLPAPEARSDRSGASGFDWFDLAIFLFFAVPIAGSLLTSLFGRKLGSLVLGGGVGALALGITASAVVAGAAALIAMVITFVWSFGSLRSRTGAGLPGGWSSGSGGGWSSGGGSSDGGFSSGGGGDFGGGGASGDW